VDQTELSCRLCCCFTSRTHLGVGPVASSVPSRERGGVVWLPHSAVGLQREAGPSDGTGARWGLAPSCLSWGPCFVEGFTARQPMERGLPWPSAPAFAQKMDSEEALVCITPLTAWSQGACHLSSTLPACSWVRNSLCLPAQAKQQRFTR